MNKTYTLYILENKVNGKRYIGQTIQPLKKRIAQHKSKSSKSVISKAIQKYGIDSFDISSFTAPTLDALNKIEAFLILQLGALTSRRGYNIAAGGGNEPATPDQKAHMRDAQTLDRRQAQSRKMQRHWQKKIGRCQVCGKDSDMGYDPDIDFRLCPSCRHAHHLAQDLGISGISKKF